MKKYIYIIVLFYQIVAAQNEGNIWYFGYGAGLDFNSGSPVPISDGQLNTEEGCASISDENGDLLFYTDGTTVYNKSHSPMVNGTNLLADSSATQSSIILKKPNSAIIYYVFTVEGTSRNQGKLCYSEIDISLNDGLGAVTNMKNIELFSDASEKVTAILHSNGNDFWIVAPQYSSGSYFSYLVTSSGVNSTPIKSPIDTAGYNSIGYLVASPDGTKICAANYSANSFDLFDFDTHTGELSFKMEVAGTNKPYGIAFSTNSNVLYVSSLDGYFQFDLSAGTNTAILNSKFLINNVANYNQFGALQLGPDQKIYTVTKNGEYVSSIDHPNLLGAMCHFNLNSVQLAEGQTSGIGLPSFFNALYHFYFDISSSAFCFGDSTSFYISGDVDSVFWDFGDTAAGAENSSNLTSPLHQFSAPGDYLVTAIAVRGNFSYPSDLLVTITAPDSLALNIGNDTILCDGDSLVLNASNRNATYLWQDMSTSESIKVGAPGLYFVEVTQNVCSIADSIFIDVINLEFDLGRDTTLCNDATILLDPTIDSVTYVWQDGSTDSTFLVSNAGMYWLEVTQNICSVADSIIIDVINLDVNLGNDTTLCNDESLVLDASNRNATYLWQDASTASTFLVSNAGLYWLEVSQNICSVADSIRIDVINLEIDLGSDTTLCYGENRLLNPTLNSDTYVWQDGSTDSTFLVSNTGLYWLEVSQNICSVADSISIAINPLVTAILSGEDSTCRGVPFTVDAMISATGKGPFSIELSNGDSKIYHYAAENEFEIPITEEGVYTISTIYGSNLCIGKVTGEAVYFTLPTPNAKFRVEAKDVFRDLGSVIFKNNSMGQTSSNWSFGDDFYLEDNSSMIYHSYGDLDTYTIQLFVENDIGCRDSTVQDFVVQSNNYFLPNAFTPFDRNNINDYFGLYNTRVQGFEMKIFDKWGKAIYVTDDIERPWDGTHKGVNVLSGVYAYTINLIDPTGALRKLKGNVFLID